MATWDGSNGVYEAAPEGTHGICDNGKTGVGHWSKHTYYNCGTGTKSWTCIYRIKEEANKVSKLKSKDYVAGALALLNRKLAYKNEFPYNCGLLDEDNVTWGDCWNINPKTMIWSMSLGEPIWENKIIGSSHVHYIYNDGIKASGLPDTYGDAIMEKYCTQTTFKQMLASKKAPCLLLINGAHMGAYLGEFTKDGKTYNVSEFSPNSYLGGKMRSYVDEYGQRWSCKGGTLLGSWNSCGYLTALLDYTDWDETPAPAPTKDVSVDELALEIYAGKWGVNPDRKTNIVKQYGEEKYTQAQKRVDSIVSGVNYYRIEIRLADEILDGKWGNNPDRQANITLKYGANVYRIAQLFVNDICRNAYTIDELYTAFDVMNGILCGKYGNGEARKTTITLAYGETVRSLAQKLVDNVMG